MKTFQIFGTNEVMSKIEKLNLKENRSSVLKILNATGEEVEKGTKARTPVDTGALRRNWKFLSNVQKFQVKIYNDLPYAAPVDLGTTTGAGAHKPGVRMLEKGIMSTLETKFTNIVMDALK